MVDSRPEKIKKEIREYGGERIEVLFRKAVPPEESRDKCPELSPGITVEDGIIIERDVPVTLRDGTIIYTDIYRPDGISKVPAIVAWSP